MTGHADIAELLKQDWAQRLCITRCATFFSARCTIVQSAVLRSHVVCLSVRPSVTLVDHDHVVLGWRPWKLNCTVKIIANTFAFRSPGGTWGNFGETRGGARKTLLSLTLVRLCEENERHRAVIFAIAQLSCFTYTTADRIIYGNLSEQTVKLFTTIDSIWL